MSVLFVALPVALLLGAFGLIACVYCISGGQYDDLDSESMRILIEDERDPSTKESKRDAGEP